MNIDLLIKLAKLANNNPNEHEANSAARRACKLMAEGDYKFSNTPIQQPKVTIRPPQTWNDVRRSKEAEFKSKVQKPFDWSTSSNPFNDYYGGFGSIYEPPKPRPEQTVRECSKCGKKVITRRVTNIFRCDECEWGDYMESK